MPRRVERLTSRGLKIPAVHWQRNCRLVIGETIDEGSFLPAYGRAIAMAR
jgi:hypothetical protein